MRQTILGVFAHPDDEVALAGLFHRAKKLGIETHLICATRGEAARIRHPEIVTIEKLNSVKCHKSQFPDEEGNYYKIPFYLLKRCAKYENYCYYKKHEAGNKLKVLL